MICMDSLGFGVVSGGGNWTVVAQSSAPSSGDLVKLLVLTQ